MLDEVEGLLPWVLTAAVEFILVQSGQLDLREMAHVRLGISRLRYGVPHTVLSDLVREGADRVEVSRLNEEYERFDRSAWPVPDRADFVRQALERTRHADEDEPF